MSEPGHRPSNVALDQTKIIFQPRAGGRYRWWYLDGTVSAWADMPKRVVTAPPAAFAMEWRDEHQPDPPARAAPVAVQRRPTCFRPSIVR